MMVIGVDTGNRLMKTAHAEPFSANLTRHEANRPPLAQSSYLLYKGKYYTVSEEPAPNRLDKSVDDHYFMLTLMAIGREIVMKTAMNQMPNGITKGPTFRKAMSEAAKSYSEEIVLSVGLPPRDVAVQRERFKEYFLQDGDVLDFEYSNISFHIKIVDVLVSPQGFAALFPSKEFDRAASSPSVYILDIGGYTLDVARLLNHKFDQSFFQSLDFGVNHMCNEIQDYVAKNCQKRISTVLIEALLRDGQSTGNESVDQTVKSYAKHYTRKIVDSLKDIGVDLELSLPVLVGGGVTLLGDYLCEMIPRKDILVLPDVKANALGYEVWGASRLKRKGSAK